jgi:hypothetical protein
MLLIHLFRVLLACALALPAHALTIEGQTFPDRIQLGGTELRLNGVGLRAVAWLKGYAAGLYLAQKASTVPDVLAAAGPKRLQMRMLVDVGAEEFVKALNKGIARNTPAAEQPALAERQRAFEHAMRAIGHVKSGDVVDLDWLPARGFVLSVNGKQRGDVLPGEDFYRALLLIFVGQRPVDKSLKSGLLGATAT